MLLYWAIASSYSATALYGSPPSAVDVSVVEVDSLVVWGHSVTPWPDVVVGVVGSDPWDAGSVVAEVNGPMVTAEGTVVAEWGGLVRPSGWCIPTTFVHDAVELAICSGVTLLFIEVIWLGIVLGREDWRGIMTLPAIKGVWLDISDAWFDKGIVEGIIGTIILLWLIINWPVSCPMVIREPPGSIATICWFPSSFPTTDDIVIPDPNV